MAMQLTAMEVLTYLKAQSRILRSNIFFVP